MQNPNSSNIILAFWKQRESHHSVKLNQQYNTGKKSTYAQCRAVLPFLLSAALCTSKMSPLQSGCILCPLSWEVKHRKTHGAKAELPSQCQNTSGLIESVLHFWNMHHPDLYLEMENNERVFMLHNCTESHWMKSKVLMLEEIFSVWYGILAPTSTAGNHSDFDRFQLQWWWNFI